MTAARAKPVVIISNSQSAMRVPRKAIADVVAFVAERQGASVGVADIAVVGAREMSSMNRRYLAHGGATDVITFDLSDEHTRGIHAQIVVCGEVALAKARLLGSSAKRELLLYVIHGLLHLMGYDDTTVRGQFGMQARQDELLEEFLSPRRRGRGRQ